MPRVAHLLASLTAILLLSGCSDADTPDRAEPDQATTSPTESSEAPETASTESPPEPQSSTATVEDPISVTLYDADFSLSVAGDLSVVETLTLDVPVDDRHGIYRTFESDTVVEDFGATLDGSRTPVADTVEGGEQVFKIGDPDQTLSIGEHVVRMEYGVAGVLTREGPGPVRLFDWQLVPGGWELDIDAADLTVRLPAAASAAECVVGDGEPCAVSGVGTTTLVITTEALADHTPVRVQASLRPS